MRAGGALRTSRAPGNLEQRGPPVHIANLIRGAVGQKTRRVGERGFRGGRTRHPEPEVGLFSSPRRCRPRVEKVKEINPDEVCDMDNHADKLL